MDHTLLMDEINKITDEKKFPGIRAMQLGEKILIVIFHKFYGEKWTKEQKKLMKKVRFEINKSKPDDILIYFTKEIKSEVKTWRK